MYNKHGCAKTPIYNIWKQMRARCLCPTDSRYKNYGARGINICPEWDDFNNFFSWACANGYESGLWLDRIDNNGDYSPNNCRWSTPAEQLRNTTRTVVVTAFGETKCAKDWTEDERCVVDYRCLLQRLSRNMEPHNALTQHSYRKTGRRPN